MGLRLCWLTEGIEGASGWLGVSHNSHEHTADPGARRLVTTVTMGLAQAPSSPCLVHSWRLSSWTLGMVIAFTEITCFTEGKLRQGRVCPGSQSQSPSLLLWDSACKHHWVPLLRVTLHLFWSPAPAQGLPTPLDGSGGLVPAGLETRIGFQALDFSGPPGEGVSMETRSEAPQGLLCSELAGPPSPGSAPDPTGPTCPRGPETASPRVPTHASSGPTLGAAAP